MAGYENWFLCVLAILFPPLAVALKKESYINWTVLINFLLFLCGVLPGIVHGWYFILAYDHYRFQNLLLSVAGLLLSPLVTVKEDVEFIFVGTCFYGIWEFFLTRPCCKKLISYNNSLSCYILCVLYSTFCKIGRAVQQECRDRSRMPSSA
eukprot:TRINITY_DN42915_c0_g1_i6.p1 TRINITY_DN42915_c0_g1~~TRINITY_DN42915_c0_g1_i6.p1  ORF type:complete len:151 (-),score=9.98 TRINITY_DN42915_c0_g1_i6:11-463(-)